MRWLWLTTTLVLLSSYSKAFLITNPTYTTTHHHYTTTHSQLMGIKGFRSWFESQFPNAIMAIPKENVTEEFDHVLIDMNQLLHICVRKSRTDGHALILLMKELDAVLQTASPNVSLVLAMDGPPSAAKLATQRKRRFATVTKSNLKLQQLDTLGPKARITPKVLARKKRRAKAEVRTLCITPGTEFMKKAEQAVLYWAWQRLSARSGILSERNIKVFISPSTVPGEGEVKLLEWLYHRPRKGDSVAILGGDSDLVLEGLVVPCASTHNVFLLMPDGAKRYLVVSVWETTRSLKRDYLQHLTIDQVMSARTDCVLLLLLNGNDYLPKLRGSSGFNRLFHSYIKLHREWKGKAPRLLNPDTLDLELDFCIDYFSYLAAMAPDNLWVDRENQTIDKDSSLSKLNNLVDGGFLPQPVVFEVLRDDDSEVNERESTEDDSDDEGVPEVDCDLVRLLLGDPKSEDFNTYEVWHPKGEPLKNAKQRLATMALRDLAGLDDEDEDDDDAILFGNASSGYDWEIRHAVDGDVEEYLYGLLWNVQTYQDGVCSNYCFNYGKRLSPTAGDIALHLKEIRNKGKSYGLKDLAKTGFSPPVSAGLSCLAALPASVKNLVPEPYSLLDDELVESIYAECMSRENNVFDLRRFEELCEEHLKRIPPSETATQSSDSNKMIDGDRRILTGEHRWTVVATVPKPLARPFAPPEPFSERLSNLRPNNRLRITHLPANERPREREDWPLSINGDDSSKGGRHLRDSGPINHSDIGSYLQNFDLKNVPHKLAYQKEKERKGRRRKNVQIEEPPKPSPKKEEKPQVEASGGKGRQKKGRGRNRKEEPVPEPPKEPVSKVKEVKKDNVNVAERMKRFKIDPPPTDPSSSKDNVTAMACLKQLQDSGLIGKLEWKHIHPSKTGYASYDPKSHECVTLAIHPSEAKHGYKELISIEQDRHTTDMTRQILKQHLADLALRKIFGKEHPWQSYTYKELRETLEVKVQVP